MNPRVDRADRKVNLRTLVRVERKPVSQTLASTIGTPTQAINSEPFGRVYVLARFHAGGWLRYQPSWRAGGACEFCAR
jgi:hypothetical protein